MPPVTKPLPPAPSTFLEVVVVATSGDLSWLSAWKSQLAGISVIVAHDPSISVTLPAGFETAKLVSKAPAGLESVASKLSIREIAILSTSKPRVLFLGEGCTPASTPKGEEVQAAAEHLYNLDTPASPFFFNTLYDPFRKGADFVRGYPFSLRDGVKTAVSHGLWLGHPDYDLATQLAKPLERNQRYVDATLTVPKQALCLFSARNLAVDKSLVGIALYNGLDSTGAPASDNTWSSFCLKALCNHLGYGAKTGLPYVTCNKANASAASADIEQQLKTVKYQKEVADFFLTVQLSESSTTAQSAYLELAGKVRTALGPVDAYFSQLADGMEAWAAAFTAANPTA